MWNTPLGDRKLTGSQRRLFIDGALAVFDSLQDEEHEFFHISENILPKEDRSFFLLRVVKQLLDNEPASALFAWNEAIIYEIYQCLKHDAEFEIEMAYDEGVTRETLITRRIIDAALKEIIPDSEERKELDLPGPRSSDFDKWDDAIETLLDEILHDRTMRYYDEVSDAIPERVAFLKDHHGVDEGYFSEAPAFVSKEEKKQLLKFHAQILAENTVTWNTYVERGKLV